MKANVHPVQVSRRDSGLWGDRMRGSVKTKVLGTQSWKSLSKNGGRKAKPGVVFAVLTSDVNSEFLTFDAPLFEYPKVDPTTVAAIILGGGAGTRLFPLTSNRAKPAIPIGGCYRLIDVPMSNCFNSGIRKIFQLFIGPSLV